jgi:hypothetical protein
VLVGIAPLVAIWIFGCELARSGLPDRASNAAIARVVGGPLGAKLLWAIEFMGTALLPDLVFSRGGLSWFGGLIAGVGTGLVMLRRYRVPLMRGIAAPALAIGHAIGRLSRQRRLRSPDGSAVGHGFSRGAAADDRSGTSHAIERGLCARSGRMLLIRWWRQGRSQCCCSGVTC